MLTWRTDQQLADVNGWRGRGAPRLARGSGQPQYLFVRRRLPKTVNLFPHDVIRELGRCLMPTLPISVLLSRPLLKRIYRFISSFFLHFPLNTLKRKAIDQLSQPHPQVKTTANRNGRQRNECSPLLRGPYTFSPFFLCRHPQC